MYSDLPKEGEKTGILPDDTLDTIREVAEEATAEYGYTETIGDTLDRVGRHVGRLELLHETAEAVLASEPGATAEFERVLTRVLPAIEPPGPTGFRAGVSALRAKFDESRAKDRPETGDQLGDAGEGDLTAAEAAETVVDRGGVDATDDLLPSRGGPLASPEDHGLPRGGGENVGSDSGGGLGGTIDTGDYRRLLLAVSKITDGAGVTDPSSRLWQYTERVSAVVDAVEPVAMLYERARGVQAGDVSLRSFTNALLAMADAPTISGRQPSGPGAGSTVSDWRGTEQRGLSASSTDGPRGEVLAEGVDVGELLAAAIGDLQATSLMPPDGGTDPVAGPVGPGKPRPGFPRIPIPFGPFGPGDPRNPHRRPGGGLVPWPDRRNVVKWELASCLAAINRQGETYRIDRIENTTHGVTDEGCVGDSVVIHGHGFGSKQKDGYVTFPGGGRAQIDSWSDTKIETSVPSGATSGQVHVCANPDVAECRGFGICVPEAKNSSSYFHVAEKPTIHEITVGGTTVSGGSVTVEACKSVQFDVDASTTVIRIKDQSGAQIFYSGARAFRRRTAGRQVSSDTEETYTVEVESICGTDSTTVTVKREAKLSASANGPLTPGDQFELAVETSCPAPSGGRTVSLSVKQGGLSLPGSVTIPHGKRMTKVTTAVSGPCGPIRVEASTNDGRTASASTTFYKKTTVNGVSPNSVTSCQGVKLTVNGSCFPTDPSKLQLRLNQQNGPSTYTASVTNVSGSPMGTSITANVGGLQPGTYDVSVRVKFGNVDIAGQSNAQLTVSGSTPQINQFDNNPKGVVACNNVPTDLNWDVSGVSEVEVIDQEGDTVVTRQYQADCQSKTDSVTVRINKPPRQYTLKATGYGSNPQTSTDSTTVNVIHTKYSTHAAGEIRIQNPDGSGTEYDIYFQGQYGSQKNYIDSVEEDSSMVVDETDGLNDCTEYKLFAFESGRNPNSGNPDALIPIYVQRNDLGPIFWKLPDSRPVTP